MIIVPIHTSSSGGGNVSNKSALAVFIALNFLLLLAFGFMYYLYKHDSFKGTFWEWSWDMKYFLKDEKTNAGLGVFFWMPLFAINGIALCIALSVLIESIFLKRMED